MGQENRDELAAAEGGEAMLGAFIEAQAPAFAQVASGQLEEMLARRA